MHVNGRGGFCHVVRGLFECRAILVRPRPALPSNDGTWTLSCKMHYPKMPSLQIATWRCFRVDSTH
ncbi:hypothetical protein DJ480_12940 [Pseudomonas sp. Leaf98]|nr:hypothetical protein DJ480_12940 [Pseudomonas sp. Leaf98]